MIALTRPLPSASRAPTLTTANLRAYQASRGLLITGVVTETQAALNASTPTADWSPAKRQALAAAIAARPATSGVPVADVTGVGTTTLFHRGGTPPTCSTRCQTMPSAEFDRMMGALREAGMCLRWSIGDALVDTQITPTPAQ